MNFSLVLTLGRSLMYNMKRIGPELELKNWLIPVEHHTLFIRKMLRYYLLIQIDIY